MSDNLLLNSHPSNFILFFTLFTLSLTYESKLIVHAYELSGQYTLPMYSPSQTSSSLILSGLTVYFSSSAVWTRSPNLSRPIFYTPLGLGMFLHDLLVKKKENIPSFQSTHFTRKFPRNLLRLKLVIVNTTKFRLMLGLLGGYKY